MINGCLEWQRIGLQPPAAVATANEHYFKAQDVLGRWIEERCVLDPKAEERPFAVLHNSFNAWAKQNNEREMTTNAFSEAIDQFETSPPLTRGRNMKMRWIKGLRLRELRDAAAP
jgi:putative DNA primase/helicase